MLTQKGVHDVTLSEKRSDRKVVVPTACWALCIIYDSVSVNATHVHYIRMYGSTYIEVLYIYACVCVCMKDFPKLLRLVSSNQELIMKVRESLLLLYTILYC